MKTSSTAAPTAKVADGPNAHAGAKIALIAVVLSEAVCAAGLYVLLDRRIGRLEALLESWGFNRATERGK